ncbi:TolC family outer membrane protein [bacterium]|nr:TolC family outer membrane protein [bacterium]
MLKLSLVAIMAIPVISSATTITEVVQKTIQTHPQMKVKKEVLYAQKEGLTKVESGYYPSIDLAYSVGPERTKTISNNREEADLVRQDASATLTQNIFSGLSTVNGVKEQEALILSANENVKETANALAIEAITAYLSVLKNDALYKIAEENVELHKKYLEQIKAKVDAGLGKSSDYKQTLSRFENVTSSRYLSELDYANALYTYQRVLPGEVTVSELEAPSITNVPSEDLDALIEEAKENNPTISSIKSEVEAAKATLKRANSNYYPTADIVVEGYWNKNVHGVSTDASEVFAPSTHEVDSGYNALLVLNYNIFRGFSDSATEEISRHKLLEKQSILADNERILKLNTQMAWRTFDITSKTLKHIEYNIQATAQTESDYQQEHELGRRSIVDLLNISVEYNNARNRKVNAEFDRLIAYYQLLSYRGKLLEEMNIQIAE